MMPIVQQEYLQTISTQHTYHCSAVNNELAATLASIKLDAQENTIDELTKHSSFILDIALKQQSLLKGTVSIIFTK